MCAHPKNDSRKNGRQLLSKLCIGPVCLVIAGLAHPGSPSSVALAKEDGDPVPLRQARDLQLACGVAGPELAEREFVEPFETASA